MEGYEKAGGNRKIERCGIVEVPFPFIEVNANMNQLLTPLQPPVDKEDSRYKPCQHENFP